MKINFILALLYSSIFSYKRIGKIPFMMEFLFLGFEPRTPYPFFNILTRFNYRGILRPIFDTNIITNIVWAFRLLVKKLFSVFFGRNRGS